VAVKIAGQLGILAFGAARAFLLAHGHELVAALVQDGQPFTFGIAGKVDARCHPCAEFGQHARVDRVGLGPPAERLGEIPRLLRIDPGMGDSRRVECGTQGGVVMAGGFEHHQASAPAQLGGEPRHLGLSVGQTADVAAARVEDIEMPFGDIDSNGLRVYGHGACPCDARSVGAASSNCSGVSGTRAGTKPDHGIPYQGSNGLPPAPTMPQTRYTGIQHDLSAGIHG